MNNVISVVHVFLLLTLNIFSSVFIVDFEQVNVFWVDTELLPERKFMKIFPEANLGRI